MEPTPTAPLAWLDAAVLSLGDLDTRAAAALARALPDPQAADLHSLRALLECIFATLADPGVQAALDAPPDADAEFDRLPRGGQDGPQTDAQRGRIYQLAHDLGMHPKYLINWLTKHWPPAVCVEELTYGQSEAAIALLERRRTLTMEGDPR
jgi:hypothetical protein